MTDEIEDTPPQSTLGYEPPRWVVTPAADVGAVALRLLGVKLLVDLISSLSYLPNILWTDAGAGGLLSPWASAAFYLAWHGALAAVLIFAARPLAEVILGRRTVAAHDLGVGAWMMLIVSGVGLALAVFSLEEAARGIFVIAARVQANLVRPQAIELAEAATLAAPILKTAVGALLFFRPSLLVTPWLRGVSSTDPRSKTSDDLA